MRSKHSIYIPKLDLRIVAAAERIANQYGLHDDERVVVEHACDYHARRFGSEELQVGILDIPQPTSLGGTWTGLDATPCGTDASALCVADYTGSVQSLFTSPSIAAPIVPTHSQTLGSTLKVNAPGVWMFSQRVVAQTAASVVAGVSIDATAAELNTNPTLSDRMVDVAPRIAAAADTDPLLVSSMPMVITAGLAYGAGALVRGHLSNNTNASATAASLVLTRAQMRVFRMGNVPRAYANS